MESLEPVATLPLAFSLFAAGLVCAFFLGIRVGQRKGVAALAFSFVLTTIVYLGFDELSGDGFNEAVIYHLRSELGGAGVGDFAGLIFAVIFSALIGGLLCWQFSVRVKSTSSNLGSVLLLALTVASLLVHPLVGDVVRMRRYLGPGHSDASSFDLLYRSPSALSATGQKLNIVYVYAESLERTYFDEAAFPGLVPGLKRLESRATTFTDIRQVRGTEWTIAGLTASQCGIPLVTPGPGDNSMDTYGAFLPAATCLGDVLSAAGYRLSHRYGGQLEFAGNRRLFELHGFSDLEGLVELRPRLDDRNYVSQWGLYDDSLLDYSFERFEELSRAGDPFGLFVLTLDTHHPRGHRSASCREIRYGDGGNPMLNAVHCADALLSRFIERIEASPHGERTLIVVGSDHLAMPNSAYEMLERLPRRDLLFVLDPRDPRGRTIAAPGSMLDIAPTLLSRLGDPVPGFGLGRDLLSGPSLVASVPDFDTRLANWTGVLRRFWALPNLADGVEVLDRSRQVKVGDVKMKLPVLLEFDQELNVQSLLLPKDRRRINVRLREGGSYLAVVPCARFRPESQAAGFPGPARPRNPVASPESWAAPESDCLILSGGNIRGAVAIAVDDQDVVDSSRLRALLRDPAGTDAGASRGTIEPMGLLVSSGGQSGFSGAIDLAPERVPRGLNVIGIRHDFVQVIGRFDPCRQPEQLVDGALSELMRRNRKLFEYIGIVVHQTAYCAHEDIQAFFSGTRLERSSEIRFEAPYLGILRSSGELVSEQVGSPGDRLEFRLSGLYQDPGPVTVAGGEPARDNR